MFTTDCLLKEGGNCAGRSSGHPEDGCAGLRLVRAAAFELEAGLAGAGGVAGGFGLCACLCRFFGFRGDFGIGVSPFVRHGKKVRKTFR
jgi:hypothetical protein